MLGLVIEHVSGKTFIDDVKQATCAPLGISDVFLGQTLMSHKRPDEALAEDPGLTPTAFDPNSSLLLPAAYGGFIVETMDSGGGLIASTPALVHFAHHYAAWGAALRLIGVVSPHRQRAWRTHPGRLAVQRFRLRLRLEHSL